MSYRGQTGQHWTSGVVPRLEEPPRAVLAPAPLHVLLKRVPAAAQGPELEALEELLAAAVREAAPKQVAPFLTHLALFNARKISAEVFLRFVDHAIGFGFAYRAIGDVVRLVAGREERLALLREMVLLEEKHLLRAIRFNDETVTAVELVNRQLGDLPMKHLCEALAASKAEGRRRLVSTVNVEGNAISDEGAKSLGLLLQNSRTVLELHAGRNAIATAGAAAIGDGLFHNRALRTLNLYGNAMGNTTRRDAGIVRLARGALHNDTLEVLDLGANGIGVAGVAALATGWLLKFVAQERKKAVAEATRLAAVAEAREVAAELRVVADKAAVYAEKAPSAQKHAAVAEAEETEAEAAAAEAQAERLVANLPEEEAEAPELDEDGKPKPKPKVWAFQKPPRDLVLRLRALRLHRNKLGDDGAAALAAALPSLTPLTELNLGSNGIGARGVEALARALGANDCLLELNLGCNPLGLAGARALGGALEVGDDGGGGDGGGGGCGGGGGGGGGSGGGSGGDAQRARGACSLERLFLPLCALGAAGAAALAPALSTNTRLQTLNLADNKLGAAGATSLAEHLAGNVALTLLNLGSNGVGDEGAAAFARAFGPSVHRGGVLRDLNLDANGIGVPGAEALGAALKGDRTLEKLSLKFNRVGSAGAQALSRLALSKQELSKGAHKAHLSCLNLGREKDPRVVRDGPGTQMAFLAQHKFVD